MVELIVLLLIVGIAFIVFYDRRISTNFARSMKTWEAGLRDQLGLDEVTLGHRQAVGLSTQRNSIAIIERSGDGYWIPLDTIAAVELVREYGTLESSFSETRTNRGSQVIGAAVGGVIAGPAGAVVGGLSGKTTTHSFGSSVEHSEAIHLKMRLQSDQTPFVSILLRDEAQVERIAARIQNAIERRGGHLTDVQSIDAPFEPTREIPRHYRISALLKEAGGNGLLA